MRHDKTAPHQNGSPRDFAALAGFGLLSGEAPPNRLSFGGLNVGRESTREFAMVRSHGASEPALHPDAHPIGRVSAEFLLRGFEVVGRAGDDILGGMIVMTMLGDALVDERADGPISIRELARRLDLPFETVRRHVRKLVQQGICHAKDGGVCLAPSRRRGARTNAILRKIYLESVRMLDGLRRIKVGSYKPPKSSSYTSRHPHGEQAIVVVAAIRVLLAALKALRVAFDGDLMSGLVFSAIRTANVKHITNKAPAANRDILPDADRRPVSILAISNSMALPYESIRRHTRKLIERGKCVRVGHNGVIVPASTFHKMTAESRMVVELVFSFMGELRASGVKV